MHEDDHPKVQVFQSLRTPSEGVPDDVMHGKRFLDPATGTPASIVDILVASGMMRPEAPAADGDGPEGGPGPG